MTTAAVHVGMVLLSFLQWTKKMYKKGFVSQAVINISCSWYDILCSGLSMQTKVTACTQLET